MTTNTAPAGFYLRRVVHLAVVVDGTPADHSLCGMALIGAIDTTADATCPDCRRVAEILAAASAVEVEAPATLTARLTIPARQLRRGDRIVNLAPGQVVTAFDVHLDGSAVDVFPTAADLDAGSARRYTVAAGDLVVVDREVHLDGRPVQAAAMPAPARTVAEVHVRGRRYTASREGVAPEQRTEVGQRVAIIVRNSRGVDVGTVFVPSGPAYRRGVAATVVGCPTSWTRDDSRHAATEILEQLGEA